VDVFAKGVRGRDAENALDHAWITANKNAIPFDTNPPLNPSGIRLGSPAVTTRGFQEPEMRKVAGLIAETLSNIGDAETVERVRKGVRDLTDTFPLYAWKRAGVAVG
jgi:glycine hydroxymethyltransferase